MQELESCGGCTSLGKGENCLEIPHADSVTCNKGSCKILSCEPGTTLRYRMDGKNVCEEEGVMGRRRGRRMMIGGNGE